jgi:hypothetical protein
MAFIVEQKVGRYTYVWEAESFWDKERKQPRQKRKFLGRKDLVTGSNSHFDHRDTIMRR